VRQEKLTERVGYELARFECQLGMSLA